jgi:hypothetical protein
MSPYTNLHIISSCHWLDIPYLPACLLQNTTRGSGNIAMAPRTPGGHCQGHAELRDDTYSAKAQTKGSPHSRKSNFYPICMPLGRPFWENSNRTQKWFYYLLLFIIIYYYLLLFIYSVNIKPSRHRFGFSLAWDW